jgi:hypothetical protein
VHHEREHCYRCIGGFWGGRCLRLWWHSGHHIVHHQREHRKPWEQCLCLCLGPVGSHRLFLANDPHRRLWLSLNLPGAATLAAAFALTATALAITATALALAAAALALALAASPLALTAAPPSGSSSAISAATIFSGRQLLDSCLQRWQSDVFLAWKLLTCNLLHHKPRLFDSFIGASYTLSLQQQHYMDYFCEELNKLLTRI